MTMVVTMMLRTTAACAEHNDYHATQMLQLQMLQMQRMGQLITQFAQTQQQAVLGSQCLEGQTRVHQLTIQEEERIRRGRAAVSGAPHVSGTEAI